MVKKSTLERAKRIEFSNAELRILLSVTGWFNGSYFKINGRRYHIGADYEPSLRQLCLAANKWAEGYGEVHDSMIERRLFKSEDRDDDVYLAGRRCDWIPTSKCLKNIENIFRDEEWLYPNWASDQHSGPPIFRDGEELMEHRKGVLVAAKAFDRYKPVEYIEFYPTVNIPQRPDLRLWKTSTQQFARVEVLTNHRNSNTWESKFAAWSEPKSGPNLWLFENRTGMVRFWNHLIRQEFVELDGGLFGGPHDKWSPVRVNDRLKRSRLGPEAYSSIDACWTIPGMLEADVADVHEWLKGYIYNLSNKKN